MQCLPNRPAPSGRLQPALAQNRLRALLRKSWFRTRCCSFCRPAAESGSHVIVIHHFCQLRFYSSLDLCRPSTPSLRLVDFLCQSDIGRILAGQGKLCQSKGIGTVRRMSLRTGSARQSSSPDHGSRKQPSIPDFPVSALIAGQSLDIWSETGSPHLRSATPLLSNTRFSINPRCRRMILRYLLMIHIADSVAAVRHPLFAAVAAMERASISATRCNLAVLELGAFAVREVSCRVTDRECVVCRSIAGTKARTAERSLHNRSRFHESSPLQPFLIKFHINRHGSRIHAQCKLIRFPMLAALLKCPRPHRYFQSRRLHSLQ